MSQAQDGPSREDVLDERRREREMQVHQRQLQFDDDGRLSRETLEALIDTSELQGRTVTLLRNYLTRSWMLANLSEAEAHDKWWKLEVMKLKVLGSHPPQESAIQGPLRAFLFDDDQEGLWGLSAAERNVIDSLFDTIQVIVTRGREGFERKQLNTQFRESRMDRLNDGQGGSSGRLTGLFNR